MFDDVHLQSWDGKVLALHKKPGSNDAVVILPSKSSTPWQEMLSRNIDATVFIFSPRGKHSEGTWSEQSHRTDIQRVLQSMRQYQHLMVIAHKESATAMLDLEDGGQHIDSMILVDPKLRKLRLQTPSVLFTHATLEHIDALRGTVRVVHAGDSDLAIVKQILEAATELRKEERPIRFSTRF